MSAPKSTPARLRVALLASLLGILAPLLPTSAAEASGVVRFTKIHYAQSGTNLNSEYVVLKNSGTTPIRIRGWEVVSAPSSDNQHYFFPRTKLAPGRSVVLYTGSGTNGPGKRYWGATTARWDNAGDKAILLTSTGAVIDTCQYAGGGTTAYC